MTCDEVPVFPNGLENGLILCRDMAERTCGGFFVNSSHRGCFRRYLCMPYRVGHTFCMTLVGDGIEVMWSTSLERVRSGGIPATASH